MTSKGKLVAIGVVLILVAIGAIVHLPIGSDSRPRPGTPELPSDQAPLQVSAPAPQAAPSTDLSPEPVRAAARPGLVKSRGGDAARTEEVTTLVAQTREETSRSLLRESGSPVAGKRTTSLATTANQPFHTFRVTRIERAGFSLATHPGTDAHASRLADPGSGFGSSVPPPSRHGYMPWDGLTADFYRACSRSASGNTNYSAQYGLSLLRLVPVGRLEFRGRVGDRNGDRFLSRGNVKLHTFSGWQFEGGDKGVPGGGPAFLNPSIRGVHAERLIAGPDSRRLQAGVSIGGASLNYGNLESGQYPRRMEAAFLRYSGSRDLGIEGALFHLGDGNRKVTASEAIRDGRGLGLSLSLPGARTLVAGSVYASMYRFEAGGRQDGVEYSLKGRSRIDRLTVRAAWQSSRGTTYRVGGYGAIQPATRYAFDGGMSARLTGDLVTEVWTGRWEQPRTRADRSQGTDGPMGSLEEVRNRANGGNRWGARATWMVPRVRTDLSLSGESRLRVLDHARQGIANYAVSATQELGSRRSASLRWNLLRYRGQGSNRYLTGDLRLGLGAAGTLSLRQQTTWQEPVGPRLVSSGEISSAPFLANRVSFSGRVSQVHDEDRGRFLPAQTQVMVSARIRLGKGWGVSPYYQVTRHRAAREQTIQVSLTNATDPINDGVDRVGQEPRPVTRQLLGGVVFEDRNDDGIRQESERGIPGVAILIDNDPKNRVYTDNGGRYRTLLRPGKHLVRMLAESIPTEYALRNLAPIEAPVIVDNPALCNFHLVREGCCIIGRVIRPRLADIEIPRAISPEGGVPGVMILLNGADFTYTDANGYFTFRPLAAGTYEVRIDTASLPFGHVVQDSPVREVMIDDNGSGEASCLFTISRPVRRANF